MGPRDPAFRPIENNRQIVTESSISFSGVVIKWTGMKRAALALVLLTLAASARAAASPDDLQRRAQILIAEIRAASSNPAKTKDLSRLKGELSALKAENSSTKDDVTAQHLKEAEEDLSDVDNGLPLPPPRPGELKPEDLPDRDAVAAMPAVPAPALQKAANAAASAGGVFDGSVSRGALVPPSSVAVPLKPSSAASLSAKLAAVEARIDEYLDQNDGQGRTQYLHDVCAGLLAQLKISDPDSSKTWLMADRVMKLLEAHPQRSNFSAIRLRVDEKGRLRIVYKLDDDADHDEDMASIDDLTAPPAKGTKPKRGRKKKSNKARGGGGGDDDSGGGKKHGHKSNGGGGGGDGDDGGGDGGDGGGGAGDHAKAPHVKGGGADGSAFDGGGDSGDVAGPSGASGGGRHGHHGRGHGGSSSAASGEDGGSGSSGDGGGGGSSGGRSGGHAEAGGSVASGAGDDNGGGAGGAGDEEKDAKVPLPKDFTSHGGAGGLTAPGGEGGGGAPHFTPKTYTKNAVPSPAVQTASSRAALLPSGSVPPSGGAAAPAPGAFLRAPVVGADEDLHDAVAAHAAESPRLTLPQPTPGRNEAPPENDDASFPWAAASGAAGIGLFIGAHLMRRRATQQAKSASKTPTLG
jgi:hypothetical protein